MECLFARGRQVAVDGLLEQIQVLRSQVLSISGFLQNFDGLFGDVDLEHAAPQVELFGGRFLGIRGVNDVVNAPVFLLRPGNTVGGELRAQGVCCGFGRVRGAYELSESRYVSLNHQHQYHPAAEESDVAFEHARPIGGDVGIMLQHQPF